MTKMSAHLHFFVPIFYLKKLIKIVMDIIDKLAKSKFRSRFKLRAKELEYIKDKGLDTIYSHACDLSEIGCFWQNF